MMNGDTQSLLMEDHIADVNGVALHYRTVGHGETLFLVSPGWGVGSVYLQRAFSSLALRCRLVFTDTRGSGFSSRPNDPTQMGSVEMAHDLEALRLHLGLLKINLFGHSNAGAIALSYAAIYPDRVNKMVLVGSQLLGLSGSADTQRILNEKSTDPRFETAVQAVSAFFAGQANPASSDGNLQSFIQRVLPLYLHRPEQGLSEARKQLDGPTSSFAFNSQYAADRVRSIDQANSLNRIRARVLIMIGRHDFIFSLSLSERIHAGIAGSRLVIFEESGHFPWLEEEELFSQSWTASSLITEQMRMLGERGANRASSIGLLCPKACAMSSLTTRRRCGCDGLCRSPAAMRDSRPQAR